MGRDVVVHLSRSNRRNRSWLGYLDIRLLGIVAAIMAVGLVRELMSGWSIFWTVLFFAGASLAFLTYYRMRQANVTLYLRGERVGITNSIRVRKEVAIEDVAALVMCSVALPERTQPLPLVVAVSKSGRCLFRLSGADQLEPTGIRSVATAAGLELRGSWTDTLSSSAIEDRYPGTISPIARFFVWVMAHRAMVSRSIFCTHNPGGRWRSSGKDGSPLGAGDRRRREKCCNKPRSVPTVEKALG
jgi:hypothetical protein